MTRLDALLLFMVIIWGANFSLVKVALRDFPELAFNSVRLVLASGVFLLAMWRRRRLGDGRQPAAISQRDWVRLAVLGAVGHFAYQFFFIDGVKRTSVANSSLILGSAPIVITVLSSMAGHERVPLLRWAGVLLSLGGLYLVVGHQVSMSAESRLGDALVLASMACWAVYSVAAQPLLKVHSPLVVTGLSITIGAGLYVLVTLPALLVVKWAAISLTSWLLMAASALLALGAAYLIWYTAVQQIGSTRTSVYSYLTPVAAMLIAAVWLGEPISGNQAVGAAAVLGGLLVTRWAPAPARK